VPAWRRGRWIVVVLTYYNYTRNHREGKQKTNANLLKGAKDALIDPLIRAYLSKKNLVAESLRASRP
jgi:hypothetical protein